MKMPRMSITAKYAAPDRAAAFAINSTRIRLVDISGSRLTEGLYDIALNEAVEFESRLIVPTTHYRVRPDTGEDLQSNLRRSKIDDYHRDKKSCRHPTTLTQNYRPSRKPNIIGASPPELIKIAKLKAQAKQLTLTA